VVKRHSRRILKNKTREQASSVEISGSDIAVRDATAQNSRGKDPKNYEENTD